MYFYLSSKSLAFRHTSIEKWSKPVEIKKLQLHCALTKYLYLHHHTTSVFFVHLALIFFPFCRQDRTGILQPGKRWIEWKWLGRREQVFWGSNSSWWRRMRGHLDDWICWDGDSLQPADWRHWRYLALVWSVWYCLSSLRRCWTSPCWVSCPGPAGSCWSPPPPHNHCYRDPGNQ